MILCHVIVYPESETSYAVLVAVYLKCFIYGRILRDMLYGMLYRRRVLSSDFESCFSYILYYECEIIFGIVKFCGWHTRSFFLARLVMNFFATFLVYRIDVQETLLYHC